MTVRTRFAPSPTGYLHIGGVRTALFNWLFARSRGGQFILRIDDTDLSRNIDEALGPILEGFRWLGIGWDEGPEVGGPYEPYFQSRRLEKYQAAAGRLVGEGKAYHCYCTPQEIDAERKSAEKAKRPYLYGRRCLKLTDEDRRRFEVEGRKPVIRFKVPHGRKVFVEDQVRGRVEQDSTLVNDLVILRGDGTATYNFASVVDDAEMQITHVIRAEEHLPNTPPQILLFEALGYPLPQFAHLPYVAAPGTREKMSKRHIDRYRQSAGFKQMLEHGGQIFALLGIAAEAAPNPVMVEFYRTLGYLPEALVNYLARLGWSLDERSEIIALEDVIANFSLERVVKSPASFDPDKLFWVEGEYMRKLSLEEKTAGVIPFLERAGLVKEPLVLAEHEKLRRVVVALGDRLKVFGDVLIYGDFFFKEEISYDEQAVKKRLAKPEVPELLSKLKPAIADAEPFTAARLEEVVRQFAERNGCNASQVIHPLRVAVTGKQIGPGVFECVEIIGREKVLERIDRALGLAAVVSRSN